MKINDALSLTEKLAGGGVAPPTQLAPYQDLNYMLKHWGGDRPEYKVKKKFIVVKKKKKKRKPEEEPEEKVKSDITVEQYGVQNTRDVAPNYLTRSLTPFFMKASAELRAGDHEPKEDYFNYPPKKKKRKKKDGSRTKRSSSRDN